MPHFNSNIPLSLYVHIPWCVRKCPYCDFNSHEAKDSLPETLYVAALMDELSSHAEKLAHRPIVSIFFGGGTPSLFSAQAIGKILEGVSNKFQLSSDTEITLEANPGTIDQERFVGLRSAGVNRLSLGIQSLQNDKLKALGRIHDRDNALRAIELAIKAGFANFNLDLMYGLPDQTIEDACHDLETAIACEPTHLSWYQLTIEPNTLFHRHRPVLPADDLLWDMQNAGQSVIQKACLQQYEVSAYARDKKECLHNRNYWEFGDYLGIGAGAHSKLTDIENGSIARFAQVKNPRDYLEAAKRRALSPQIIAEKDIIFEFMLNALRLTQGVPTSLFSARTGLPISCIDATIEKAKKLGLLKEDSENICPSEKGRNFLNDLVEMFLPSP
jgi:putative oxygen-independent coproporphyrinogen III oxidase